MTEPMTLTEFEREAASVAHKTIAFSLAIYPWEAKRVITNLRPLILRLLAAERERCKERVRRTRETCIASRNELGVMTCDNIILRIDHLGDPT